MKQLLFTLFMLNGIICQAQVEDTVQIDKPDVLLSDFSVEMNFHSLDELEGFEAEEFREILETVKQDAPLSFKIIYSEEKKLDDKGNQISYTIKGNSNEIESFLQKINKAQRSFENYLNNKK